MMPLGHQLLEILMRQIGENSDTLTGPRSLWDSPSFNIAGSHYVTDLNVAGY